jgi:holo-[acyl-carrier protein] synthase
MMDRQRSTLVARHRPWPRSVTGHARLKKPRVRFGLISRRLDRLRGPLGVGIDQVAVAEFERLPFEEHQPFYRRLFTAEEIAYCRVQPLPAQHFGARFAAKEAAVKAYSQLVRLAYWQVEVIRGTDGAPALRLWNADRSGLAAEGKWYRAFVSLSHTDELATALVIVCKKRS